MFPFNKNNIYLYGYARGALLAGLSLFETKGKNILVPGFVCNVVIDTLKAHNVNYKEYNLFENLKPDMNDIIEKIDNNTVAIIIVNYFGFSQINYELITYCKNNNLIIIEDNAHGFLSKKDGRYLGEIGDISLFSFRKTIRIPNGAALLVNNSKLLKKIDNIPKFIRKESGLKICLKNLACLVEYFTGLSFKNIRKLKRDYSTYNEDEGIKQFLVKLSHISEYLLHKIIKNDKQIINKRRERYNYFYDYCKVKYNLLPIFLELDKDICPYAIPFMNQNRNNLVVDLREQGFNVGIWPTTPIKLDLYSSSIRKLYQQLFLIYLND